MTTFKGSVEGKVVGRYRKGKFTYTCRITSDGWYTATWNNGRQTNVTYASKDKEEINNHMRHEILDGYRRIYE